MLRRAIEVKHAGSWEGQSVAAVTLAFADRHRRRIRMTDDDGEPFLLDLPDAHLLVGGDGLLLEKGGLIEVLAASEEVLDIHTRDAQHAARIAWHIGNRHTPLQVLPGGILRIQADHVLKDMVIGLGGRVAELSAPFEPEGGAYSSHATGHSHDH